MKSDEQNTRDLQGAGFGQLQLREMQEGAMPAIPIAQPVYPDGSTGYLPQQGFSAYPPGELVVDNQADRIQIVNLLLKLQKLLKWLSIADIVSILFFMVGLYFPLLIFLPVPLLGFFASRRLSRGLSVCYMVWLCFLILIIRLILLFWTDSIAFVVIDFLLLIFDACVMVITVRFYLVIGQASPNEIDSIKQGNVGQRTPQLEEAQQPQFQPQIQFQPQYQAQMQPQFQSQPPSQPQNQSHPQYQAQYNSQPQSQPQSQYQPQPLNQV
jgi:hypothetical protein